MDDVQGRFGAEDSAGGESKAHARAHTGVELELKPSSIYSPSIMTCIKRTTAAVAFLLLPLVASALLATACADSEPRRVELVVDQIFGVSFENMLPGIAHTNDPDQLVTTEDMRTQPNYTQLLPELVCVGLDLDRSFLEVMQLTKPDVAAVLFNYKLDIRELGMTAWTTLGQMEAPLSDKQVVFMNESPAWAVSADGVALLKKVALSPKPQYQVRFTGTAPDARVTFLELEVNLQLKFANMTSECP